VTIAFTRRTLLATATGAIAVLAGCLSGGLPGQPPRPTPDRSLFVGAFHWGYTMLAGDGTPRTSVTVSEGDVIRLVAFNMEAETATGRLPRTVRANLPDHERLEAANDADVPAPADGTLEEARTVANQRYPDHSVALVPSGGYGGMMGRGGMGRGGMPFHPLFLGHDASTPVEVTFDAAVPDEYSLSCMTYCGYGHPYMDLDDALVVR